jgi:DNA-binding MarR family transcriptional regulator
MTTPDLGLLFNSAGHAVDAELTAKLAELGTTPRPPCVLGKARGQELTQSRLGELAGLDKTTMVVTMDHLEKAGLARREPSRTDRRARIVRTTDEGREVVERARTIIDGVYAEVLGVLPEPQREVLLDALVVLVGRDGPLAAAELAETRPRARRSSRIA